MGGRSKKEGMYGYIADSLCCTAETNTIFSKQLYSIKKKEYMTAFLNHSKFGGGLLHSNEGTIL